jgi:hypothetical protein
MLIEDIFLREMNLMLLDVRSSSVLIRKPIFNYIPKFEFNGESFFQMLMVINLGLKNAYDCGFNAKLNNILSIVFSA